MSGQYTWNKNDLIFVFRRASHFLFPHDSLNLLYLNHFFLKNLPNHEYYFYLSKSIASWIANLNENDTEILNYFAKFLECSAFPSYEDLYNCIKSSQNLIKNPCGELQFEYWSTVNGGDGWNIEDWSVYRHKQTVFASSYDWCDLIQTINIPYSSQNRFCIVGAYISRKSDFEVLAKLKIILYDENHEITDILQLDEVEISQYWPDFYMLKCKFEIQDYHREAEITYSGKGTRWWGGHFGARFAYCYARIFNSHNI